MSGLTLSPVHAGSRHFTASAVVIDPVARLVLLVDHQATGRRQIPGGHIDPDETGDEAAIREVAEETGVHAMLWQPCRLYVPGARVHPVPLLVAEFPAPAKPHKGEPAHHHIDLLYVATADSTAPTTRQPGEVDAVVWQPINNLDLADVRADVPPVVALAWHLLRTSDTRPTN